MAGRPWQIGLTLARLPSVLYLLEMERAANSFLLLAALFGTAGLFVSNTAHGAPVVVVRERTDIELAPVRRVGDSAHVRGRVLERSTGHGAEYVVLKVVVNDHSTEVLTDADGEFSVFVPFAQGRHRLAVTFGGDASYEGSSVEMQEFDISRRPLALRLDVPSDLEYGADSLEVGVSADSDGEPVAIDVRLHFGDAAEEKPFGRREIRTDTGGKARVQIPTAELGSPGRKRISASFAGDSGLDAAETQRLVDLRSRSELLLEPIDDHIAYGHPAIVRGRLLNGRGDGIPKAFLSLMIGSQDVADTTTDERGTFSLRVESEELGPGPATVQVVFAGQRAYAATRSRPIALTVDEQEPVPVAYTLAAFSATFLALLSFVALRTRPWERWTTAAPASSGETEARSAPLREPTTGLEAARPGLVSTLRRPADFSFVGTVVDAVTSRCIPRAELCLEGPGEPVRLTADENGHFSVDSLSSGSWATSVRAPGYISERLGLHVPHHGEFRGSRVRLLPVRERVFALYKGVAEALLPRAELWGIWTPRQIVEHVRESGRSEALSALTNFVEEVYFSQRVPHESVVAEAQTKIEAATRELNAFSDKP